MSVHPHSVLAVVAIVASSFTLPCLSSYPALSEDNYDHLTPLLSTSPISYYHHSLGFNKVMSLGRGRGRVSHPRALAPSASPNSPLTSSSRPANVDHFLRRNGKGDHTKAFRRAWKQACSSSKAGVFLVPPNKYRVRPITFSGPCRSPLVIKILGNIEASVNVTHYKDRQHWLVFQNIRNFKVEGRGSINGHGSIWWQNSCKINKTKPCQHAPTAVSFIGCNNFVVDGLRIMNAQQMHLTFQRCANVRASNLMISSPGTSPNTDGIHITQTRNVQITRSIIKTGDDCISIVSGSKNVHATEIMCGPGHGISIGSLGKGESKAHVSDVLVSRARLSGTTNGVRIKTWQGGLGYAKNIIFQDIVMHNVSNPIIINQHYCDQNTPCQHQDSAVHISNVVYKNIRGTSASDVAIKLECSQRHPCKAVVLQNINLVNTADTQVKADCQNVQLLHRGKVSPTCSPHL